MKRYQLIIILLGTGIGSYCLGHADAPPLVVEKPVVSYVDTCLPLPIHGSTHVKQHHHYTDINQILASEVK